VSLQVELQIVDAQTIFVFRGSAPQQRAHPGKQLGKRERLYQIIVRLQFKSFHLIVHTVACGEKKNGRARSAATQFRDHLPTVLVWQHDIDDEKIELGRASKLQAGFAIPRRINSEASFAQTFGQKAAVFFSSSITKIRIASMELCARCILRRRQGNHEPGKQECDCRREKTVATVRVQHEGLHVQEPECRQKHGARR
jgi:hypothetical protein